jgi:hypothetical protein
LERLQAYDFSLGSLHSEQSWRRSLRSPSESKPPEPLLQSAGAAAHPLSSPLAPAPPVNTVAPSPPSAAAGAPPLLPQHCFSSPAPVRRGGTPEIQSQILPTAPSLVFSFARVLPPLLLRRRSGPSSLCSSHARQRSPPPSFAGDPALLSRPPKPTGIHPEISDPPFSSPHKRPSAPVPVVVSILDENRGAKRELREAC